ncbi:MAG: hypothetical protein K2M48_07160, partial [Clostridiales bacterium]|nr:hypothetical protein [Clostridiales bacterium]
MSEFREKLKSMIGDATRRTVISVCVMIAVSLVMIFTALFAPFRYFSDKDVLHIVYTETEDGGEAVVTVSEIKHVRQSLFRVFEAAILIDDATTLHAASQSEIYDQESYDRARERLSALRAEYSDIINRTKADAKKKGIAEGSAEYSDMLADNLSEMNLMALDMLETAFASDNSGSYETVHRGVMLGLFEGLINLLIIVAAITAIVFAVFRFVTKSQNSQYSLFF